MLAGVMVAVFVAIAAVAAVLDRRARRRGHVVRSAVGMARAMGSQQRALRAAAGVRTPIWAGPPGMTAPDSPATDTGTPTDR